MFGKHDDDSSTWEREKALEKYLTGTQMMEQNTRYHMWKEQKTENSKKQYLK